MLINSDFESDSWFTIVENVKEGLGPLLYPVGSRKRINQGSIPATCIVLDHNRDGNNTMTIWFVPDTPILTPSTLQTLYANFTPVKAIDKEITKKIPDIDDYNYLGKGSGVSNSINMGGNTRAKDFLMLEFLVKTPRYPKRYIGHLGRTGEIANSTFFYLPSITDLGVRETALSIYNNNYGYYCDGVFSKMMKPLTTAGDAICAYEYFLKKENRALGYKYWTRSYGKLVTVQDGPSYSYINVIKEDGSPDEIVTSSSGSPAAAIVPYFIVGQSYEE